MATRPYETMSKAELLAEVGRLSGVAAQHDLAGPVEDTEAAREQIRSEHELLVRSQRLLEESRDQYSDLFQFAPIGYALLDANGILKDINLTGAKLIGAHRAGLLGYPFHSFVMEGRAFIDYIGRCRRSREPVEAEMMLRIRNGQAIPVQLTAKPFRHADSDLTLHMAIFDMTERSRAEEERLRIEGERQLARAANEAKDRFIAVLSHELRTPLTPILFALASIRETGSAPAALAPALEMIGRNVELEARLIDDLLDVTRITQGQLRLVLETVDAHAVVEEVLELCREDIQATGANLSLELEASDHHVTADATRLRQVLWNLLKNATRSTPAGGRITISTTNEVAGRLTLAVHDTGIGISSVGLEQLFRPFEQAGEEGMPRSAGLGLGLAIAKGIVDAHGGRIWAMSRGLGQGATFTVEVAVARALPAVRRAPGHAALPAGQARVLLVEDNRDNGSAIAELLRAHGYEVELAESVHDALGKAKGGFDVLVSDIGLPDGNGRDLMRRLAAERPVRAIALTGYGSDDDVRSNSDAGFSRHLTKPVDPDELLAAIHDLAAGAAARPERAREH